MLKLFIYLFLLGFLLGIGVTAWYHKFVMDRSARRTWKKVVKHIKESGGDPENKLTDDYRDIP